MRIYNIDVYKNWICYKLSYLLPARLVYYVIIRAFAYTSCVDYPNKQPDEITFSNIAKSWKKIYKQIWPPQPPPPEGGRIRYEK